MWRNRIQTLGSLFVALMALITACASGAPEIIEATVAPTLTDAPVSTDATLSPTSVPSHTPTSEPTPTASVTPTEAPPFPVLPGEIIYVLAEQTSTGQNITLKAIGADGQRDRILLSGGDHLPSALSPDHRYLALTGGSGPSILDLQTGEHIRIQTVEGQAMQVAWTPDSQTLFFTSWSQSQQSLRRISAPFDAPAEEVTRIFNINGTPTMQREFVASVGDEYLLFNDSENYQYRVILYNWQTHAERVLLDDNYGVASISDDGTRLLLFRDDEVNYVGATSLDGFFIADLNLTDGFQNIERVVTDDMETLFAFTPRLLPDNRTILSSRYRHYPEQSVYHFSDVLLTPRADGSYDEMPIVPIDSPTLVWIARWNSSGTVLVYQQVDVGRYNQPTIWLLPLDGSPARYLADGQNPFIVGPCCD